MTIQALNAKQLRPNIELASQEIQTKPSWTELQPKLQQTLAYFLQQSDPLLVIQAPEFLDAEQVLRQFIPRSNTVTSLLCVYDPKRPQQPQTYRLPTVSVVEINQMLAAFFSQQQALSEQLPAELIAHLNDLSTYLAQHSNLSWQVLIHMQEQHPALTNIQPWTRSCLFGEIGKQCCSQQLSTVRFGELAKAHQGLLLVEAKNALLNYPLWLELKQWVLEQELTWQSSQGSHYSQRPQPLATELKLLVWGDPYSLASLYEADDSLRSQVAIEIELDAELANSIPLQQAYIAELNHQLRAKDLPVVPIELYSYFLQLACSYSEHQHYFNLNFNRSIKLWAYACYQQSQPDIALLQQCQKQLSQQTNIQQQYSDQAFAEQQTKIWVNGSVVGQINGLSIIDFNGVGQSFGEPIRITATIHQGDGDLADVERKSELAGNIHAKSMMIIQGYLSSQFAHEHHFPLSGTLVFEQSYHEIDGDSASLAGAIAMLSALAKQGIKQSLAVTGAIDQQGNVLAVGGVNEKIEGFFRLCQLKGLTGQQGVIIPDANKLQLNLAPELVAAVEQDQFHIYALDHIHQAIPLLLGIEPGSIEQQDSLFGKIYNTVVPSEELSLMQALWARFCDLVK